MDELLEELSIAADEERMDDSLGNAYTFGWFALFTTERAILVERLNELSLKLYDSYSDLMIAWRDTEDQWNAYARVHGID